MGVTKKKKTGRKNQDQLQVEYKRLFQFSPTHTSRMGFDGHYVAGLVTLSTLFGMASLSFAFFLIHQLY